MNKNSAIPPQELTKYNRVSGKKTLQFMGILIGIVALLVVILLVQLL